MKRLEKQNILNQFNLNEIINHFQNGIDSIENQFNIADYLTPKVEKYILNRLLIYINYNFSKEYIIFLFEYILL